MIDVCVCVCGNMCVCVCVIAVCVPADLLPAADSAAKVMSASGSSTVIGSSTRVRRVGAHGDRRCMCVCMYVCMYVCM